MHALKTSIVHPLSAIETQFPRNMGIHTLQTLTEDTRKKKCEK